MSYQAIYEVCKKNTETGEISVVHTQKNLITDYGLNYFGNGAKTKTTNSNWTLNQCGVWLKDFADPTVELEELYIPYASGADDVDIRTKFLHNVNNNPWSPQYGVTRYDDGKECYLEQTYTYTFPHKYVVGDMYGIYLGCMNATGDYVRYPKNSLRVYPWEYDSNSNSYIYVYDHVFSIFSAIKFKDEDGQNTTIQIEEIEQLFIKYTLRQYLPKYTSPKEYEMTTSMGTTHRVIVEPTWWDERYHNGGNDNNNYRGPFTGYTNNYNTLYGSELTLFYTDGGSDNYNDYSSYNNYDSYIRPYEDYTYKQATSYYLDLDTANKPIERIYLNNSMGKVRLTFDPPIDKTNERKFNLTFEWGWGRTEDLYVNRGEVVVRNNNFEIDLSEWDLTENSELIYQNLNDKSSVYLSGISKTESISQVLDLTPFILENRRLTVAYESASYYGDLSSFTLEYMNELDEVIHTQDITSLSDENTEAFSKLYKHFNIPEEAYTAQKVNLKLNLETGNRDNSYIAVTNIEVLITNMTPIN